MNGCHKEETVNVPCWIQTLEEPNVSIEGKTGGSIAPMHHSWENIEENIIDTNVPAIYVGLQADEADALAYLWKEMHPVCPIKNIDLLLIVVEQESERG